MLGYLVLDSEPGINVICPAFGLHFKGLLKCANKTKMYKLKRNSCRLAKLFCPQTTRFLTNSPAKKTGKPTSKQNLIVSQFVQNHNRLFGQFFGRVVVVFAYHFLTGRPGYFLFHVPKCTSWSVKSVALTNLSSVNRIELKAIFCHGISSFLNSSTSKLSSPG